MKNFFLKKLIFLQNYIELGRSQLDVQIETLMMVDSLDMTLESKKTYCAKM